MREYVTGYCPVHGENVEVQVNYVVGKAIGSPDIRKVDKVKCNVFDSSRPECSHCPIVFPTPQRP